MLNKLAKKVVVSHRKKGTWEDYENLIARIKYYQECDAKGEGKFYPTFSSIRTQYFSESMGWSLIESVIGDVTHWHFESASFGKRLTIFVADGNVFNISSNEL